MDAHAPREIELTFVYCQLYGMNTTDVITLYLVYRPGQLFCLF